MANSMRPIGRFFKDELPKPKQVKIETPEIINESANTEIHYTLDDVRGKLNLGLLETVMHLSANPIVRGNKRRNALLEKYKECLYAGIPEERIVTDFLAEAAISAFDTASSTGYNSEIGKLKTRVDNNKVNIDLIKILEVMAETQFAYIVPLIEDDVVRYVKEKTPQNKYLLEQALASFSGNEFVQQILEVLAIDADKRNFEMSESFISTTDHIKFIRENSRIENIYSPVVAVSEGAVFNANGTFYIKKGNALSKLSVNEFNLLDESFVQFCNLINDSRVKIFEDHIELNANNKSVIICEDHAEINGNKENAESLRNINEMMMTYDDFDANFWMMTSCLLENFNNIANIDFAKRIYTNGDDNLSVDLFRLNENLYVTTNDDEKNYHTLYKNLNPIQCSNIMNEHLGIKASNLFEDLMPEQDKFIFEATKAQKEYEDGISKYEDMLDRLNAAMKDAEEVDAKRIEKKVEDIQTKLDDLKAEYEKWQDEASKALNAEPDEDDEEDEEDLTKDTKVEVLNQPDDEKTAVQRKDEFSAPLTSDSEETPAPEETDTEESTEDYDDVMNREIARTLADSPLYNGKGYSEEEEDEEPAFDEEMATPTEQEIASNVNAELGIEGLEGEVEKAEVKDDEETEDLFSEDQENADYLGGLESDAEVVDVNFDSVPNSDATNKFLRSGNVTIKRSLIDGAGIKNVQFNTYKFALDDNNNIMLDFKDDTERLPESTYSMMVDAIKDDEMFDTIAALTTDEDPWHPKQTEPEGDFSDMFTEVPEDDSTMEDVKTPSYKSGETDIEMPAKNVDNSVIKESHILNIKGIFANPVTEKLTIIDRTEKKKDEKDVAEDSDTDDNLDDVDIIESNYTTDQVYIALKNAAEELAEEYEEDIKVEDTPYNDILCFSISDSEDETNSYAVYSFDDKIYISPKADFDAAIEDAESDEDAKELLKVEYSNPEEELESYDGTNSEEAVDELSNIFLSIINDDEGIKERFAEALVAAKDEDDMESDITSADNDEDKDEISEGLLENAKIRKFPKKDADKKVEDSSSNETNECNSNNANIVVPNVHRSVKEDAKQREFHVGDEIIYKGQKGQIHGESNDGTFIVTLQDGITVEGISPKQLIFAHEQPLDMTPNQFDGEKDPMLLDTAIKNNDSRHRNLNARIPANIVVDGYRLNNESCSALLKDVLSKRETIHVINEYGQEDRYPRENVEILDIDAVDWPWAIYTLASDDEPDRKIKVNPRSFIDAQETEEVECILNNELVKLPKSAIRMQI